MEGHSVERENALPSTPLLLPQLGVIWGVGTLEVSNLSILVSKTHLDSRYYNVSYPKAKTKS